MKRILFLFVSFVFFATLISSAAMAEEQRLWARENLWNPNEIDWVDTSKCKKDPPYTFGFSNAGLTNPWTVLMQRQAEWEASKHPELIKKMIVTDAQGKADKQINDVEDLYAKGIDILLTRAVTESGLDPIITRLYKQGLPVITISKGIKSDNYSCFVAPSNIAYGRIQGVWLAQMLNGKGNILILAGWAGAGSVVDRYKGHKEALSQYPGIKVLDRQYTQYSTSKGKEIMQAMIQSYGDKIDGVLCDSGMQAAGAVEAMHEAGMKVPITGDPLNAFLCRVQKWGFPAVSVGYPVSMGSDAVKLGLNILQGIPVPFNFNPPRLILTTHDTADVRTDVPWSSVANPKLGDSWYLPYTLPEEWLPK